MKRIRMTVCLLFGTVCFVVASITGWNFYSVVRGYIEADSFYEDISAMVKTVPAVTTDADDIPETGEGTVAEIVSENAFSRAPDQSEIPPINWDALMAVNPDSVGWIWIPGTDVDYPVMQGEDDGKYLTVLVDGTSNSSGSIFMEYLNVPNLTDDNTVLYGHHMRNGAMFENLVNYKDQEYYEEHFYGWYLTPEADYRLDFFAGYECAYDSDAYVLNFGDKLRHMAWFEDIAERSDFYPVGIGLGVSDRIMTLSTCDYDWKNARYVLHAKLVPVS